MFVLKTSNMVRLFKMVQNHVLLLATAKNWVKDPYVQYNKAEIQILGISSHILVGKHNH